MTCDECTARLSDALDGELDAATAASVDAHLRGCTACRGVADDLQTVAAAARDLERHPVPPAAWARIAARLDEAGPAPAWLPGWLRADWRSAGWQGIATAAAVVVLLAAGGAWLALGGGSSGPTVDPTVASANEAIQTVETELSLAQEHYENAIAGLERLTTEEAGALDPEIAAVLQRNLTVIDEAIDESRAALDTQPTSEVAQQSLFGALRSKVALLQDTLALINEMRQGDQAGAARVLSGISQ